MKVSPSELEQFGLLVMEKEKQHKLELEKKAEMRAVCVLAQELYVLLGGRSYRDMPRLRLNRRVPERTSKILWNDLPSLVRDTTALVYFGYEAHVHRTEKEEIRITLVRRAASDRQNPPEIALPEVVFTIIPDKEGALLTTAENSVPDVNNILKTIAIGSDSWQQWHKVLRNIVALERFRKSRSSDGRTNEVSTVSFISRHGAD